MRLGPQVTSPTGDGSTGVGGGRRLAQTPAEAWWGWRRGKIKAEKGEIKLFLKGRSSRAVFLGHPASRGVRLSVSKQQQRPLSGDAWEVVMVAFCFYPGRSHL